MRSRMIVVMGLALSMSMGAAPAGVAPQRVEARLVLPGADATADAVLYKHQDCIDEAAGVVGVRGHGQHVSAAFTAPAATMTLFLDTANLAAATCLATSVAGLPPRNLYIGHYEFVLTDADLDDVPLGEQRERFRCEYIGLPTVILGNFSCSGLQTFWGNRLHTITVRINPTADVLGISVPSIGAVELTVSA